MNKEIFILVTILLSVFISGCASHQLQAPGAKDAVLIQTKALIKNDSESNTVKIEIALLPEQAIRLEISASLGVSVASVLLTPTEIAYALHANKQYVAGPFNAKTMYPIFKKKVDPRILWYAIHNRSMSSLKMNCENDAEKRPIKCVGQDGTSITWKYEEAPRKRIDIISNNFEMNWIFRDLSPLDPTQNRTFVLKKPANYQEIIIK